MQLAHARRFAGPHRCGFGAACASTGGAGDEQPPRHGTNSSKVMTPISLAYFAWLLRLPAAENLPATTTQLPADLPRDERSAGSPSISTHCEVKFGWFITGTQRRVP